jgi:Na+/H+-translocating membrane pyrophosphatase
MLLSVLAGFVCQLDTAGVITENGASVEKMPPRDPTVRHFLD